MRVVAAGPGGEGRRRASPVATAPDATAAAGLEAVRTILAAYDGSAAWRTVEL